MINYPRIRPLYVLLLILLAASLMVLVFTQVTASPSGTDGCRYKKHCTPPTTQVTTTTTEATTTTTFLDTTITTIVTTPTTVPTTVTIPPLVITPPAVPIVAEPGFTG